MKFRKGDKIQRIGKPEEVYEVLCNSYKGMDGREYVVFRGNFSEGAEPDTDPVDNYELVPKNQLNTVIAREYGCGSCDRNLFLQEAAPGWCPFCGRYDKLFYIGQVKIEITEESYL
jgi:rubrerythrin